MHHPISGLDHVLAMVAVLLPVTFPMVMAFGGFLIALSAILRFLPDLPPPCSRHGASGRRERAVVMNGTRKRPGSTRVGVESEKSKAITSFLFSGR